MIPSLNGIKAFEVVARHRSFTLAAKELNVTQSAISHQVRKLEQHLGVRLFYREGNELSLTIEGQNLFPDVHQALTLIKRSIETLQEDISGRPMGLWLRPHFALKWLAPRLMDFRAKYPGFDLRLMHSTEPANFSNSAIDMSIEWLRRGEVRDNAHLLVEGRMTPACSPSLLAKGPSVAKPEDLNHHTLLHEADATTWQEWMEVAGVPGLRANNNHFFDDTNVRQQAAIEGEGFVLISQLLAHDDLESGRLVCPLDISLETHDYYIVYPANGQLSKAAKAFSTWLFSQID